MSMPSFNRIPSYPLPTSTPFTRQTAFSFIERLEDLYVIVREAYDLISTRDVAYQKLISDANTAIESALEIIKTAQDDVEANAAEVRATLAALVDALDRLTVAESSLNTASNNFNTKVAEFQGMVTAFGKRLDALEIEAATHVSKDHLFIDVTDHGAKGDGVTDDHAAITAAIQAAGEYGSVFFPEGIYICSKPLIQLQGQRWSSNNTAFSVRGNVEGVVLKYTGQNGSFVSAGHGGAISGVSLFGPGATFAGTIGFSCESNSAYHLENMVIQGFDHGAYLRSIWYGTLNKVFIFQCTLALDISYCYNLNIYDLRAHSAYPTNGAGNGVLVRDASMITIHGGSIEGYVSFGVKATGHATITAVGLYVESSSGVATKTMAWDLREWIGFGVINVIGGQYYVTKHRSIFDFSAETRGHFNASGNTFKGGADGEGTTVYRWILPNDGLTVNIQGDQPRAMVKSETVRYMNGPAIPGLSRVVVPYGTNEKAREISTILKRSNGYDTIPPVDTRPPSGELEVGSAVYYTADKCIHVWTGSGWVDTQGNPKP